MSQQGDKHLYDVLIIGSGCAGLMAAIELSKAQPHLTIALLAKNTLSESNSYYAQGGIAASLDNDESKALHYNDTLRAGDGKCHKKSVAQIIHQGPHVIQSLQSLNVSFDSKEHLGMEGGHSERRIYHCGDATGRSIIKALIQNVSHIKNVTILEQHCAINLITHHPLYSCESKSVLGAYVLNEATNLIDTYLAKATVLATGGAGKTYRYTSNPEVATGDGLAMAARAGCRISNMAYYQFHPTLLYHNECNNFLISEALRGEGARLLRADTLKPFMQDYAPKQKDLATRDIVARAIFNEIEQHTPDFVYLDISHHSKAFLEKRFPTIYQQLTALGIAIEHEPIPVVPAAHYQCGGIVSDAYGQTDIVRLYAIGEVSCTGLHGANRLASNSLLEGLCMGQLLVQAIQKSLQNPLPNLKKGG